MNGKHLKVLCLFDADRNCGADFDFGALFAQESWKTEAHVVEALKGLGHEVRAIGLKDDVRLLLSEVEAARPDVVFNLVEVFAGDSRMDAAVASMLELLKLPFTGCGPLGLRLCRDKSLAKQILTFHGLKNARFQTLLKGASLKRDAELSFPMLIKPLVEDASYDISQASFVEDDAAFEERVRFLQESRDRDVIAEEYVEGRELYVGVVRVGKRLKVFPPRELHFGEMPEDGPRIATYKAKWSDAYRRRWGLRNDFAEGLEEAVLKAVEQACKDAFKALRLEGYARMDLRLRPDGEPFIIEANPNPHLAKDEDFALSADRAGLSYDKLIQTLLDDALTVGG